MLVRLGVFITSFFCAFAVVHNLLDKNVSANLLHAFIALILVRVIWAVLKSFLPKPHVSHLKEKAVFITGCDTGFGNEAARRLDALGVTVYAGCLFPKGLHAKELKENSSERLHIVPLDVTKDNDVEAAVNYVKTTLGNKVLWAVVNNAGIVTLAEIEWIPMEDIQKVMDVNFFGQVRVTKAFIPMLRESKGRIVNVNSLAGRVSFPLLIPYCSSKYAGIAFAEGLRLEMKKFSISVHSIEPWCYATPMKNVLETSTFWDNCPADIKRAYVDNYYPKLQKKIKRLVHIVLRPPNKIYVIADSIVDGCIGKEPQDNYRPSFIGKLLVALCNWLPSSIGKILTIILTPK